MEDFMAAEPQQAYTGGTMRRSGSRYERRWLLRSSLGLGGLALLSGCGITPPWAQPPTRVARIGWMTLIRSDDPARALYLDGFRQGMREHGWIEGRHYELDARAAEGQAERLPALIAELVRREPDVLVAAGGYPTVRAAMDATGAIPIVFPAYGGDPVADGIVASLARPGGNVTGFISSVREVAGKRLELLQAIVPGLSRVAVLWNAASAAVASDWQATQAAAQVLRIRLLSLVIRGPEDLDGAFQVAAGEAPEALSVLTDAVTLTQRARIIEFAAKNRLPALYAQREIAEDGGLMVYGPSLRELFRQAATHVDKILKGTKPAELPVERPRTFDFVVNLRTAQALGISMPPSVLQQATELIR
jgi:putative tryptophan/tyrosine transport system substrate-binding protein